ncbi:hypothetical protein MMC21_003527 [Puttea exsequens]|nr:hypothetical protein [Puttea exsequens]
MRSAFGQQGKGLRGMYGFSRIPECWGIYGVDNSGQDDYNTWRMSMFGEGGLRVPSADLQSASRERTIFESGGVAVLRPLLNFPKQRLLDTCHANGVVWEEDPTNYDLWRTPRNTVRAFLASSKLPQALREGPLLRVAQNRVKRFAEIDGWSKRLFDHCEIAVFDVRSARLVVRLVEDSFVGSLRIRDLLLARLCVAAMLARFVNMVSPIEHVSMESLHFAALSVFPELLESDNSLNPRLQPEGFTDGGVQFRRVRLPLDPHRSSIQQTNPNFVWQLTRQPYSKVLPDFRVAGAVNGAPKWSPWKLWDGRYWIRIFNPLPLPVAVRPLRPTDLSGIRSTLSPDQWNKFYESLKDAAPDNTRWTLPVIAEDNSENITSGGVLALPTLEPPCLIDISSAEGSRTLQWEIRYKKIVLDYENKMLEEKRALKTWAD